MLKSLGEKVGPKEIENVLHAMDGVAEAAVIGAADPVPGQAIVAFVLPFAIAALDPDSVRARCARHLEDYRVPRFVEVLLDLPKTGRGKVGRIALSRRRE